MRGLKMVLLLAMPLLGQEQIPVPEVPLPTVDSVLRGLESKMAAAGPLMDRYGYIERTTQHLLDEKGKVTETETKEYEVTPVKGTTIRRLLKVNGEPLSEKAAKKEDARVMKEAEKADQADTPGVHQVGLRNLLKFLEITSLRRGLFRNVQALILDFKPRKDVKTQGKGEEFASKLGGTLYLDEGSLEAIHLDARLTGSIRVGWGLASISEGASFSQDFQRVNGEVTLPTQMSARVEARVLFGHARVAVATEWSAFQKFDVEASQVTDVQVLAKSR
jgi:hypothetical protein